MLYANTFYTTSTATTILNRSSLLYKKGVLLILLTATLFEKNWVVSIKKAFGKGDQEFILIMYSLRKKLPKLAYSLTQNRFFFSKRVQLKNSNKHNFLKAEKPQFSLISDRYSMT